MNLTSGTVTFLLTDIEGSAALWEADPDGMSVALARHETIAAATIASYNGSLVKSRGEGDSLFAVFARASEALRAACDLQCSFVAEQWDLPTPLKVRIALHTGDATVRDNDYYGPTVNRCARLRAIAYGGQILLSGITREMVSDSLPLNVLLRDLGQHRLKDLTRPETVFQLLHPDLPSEFPALRTLGTLPNNLPQQLTSFIGREKEIAEVKRLLTRSRLVTLTGSGGAGKTRLSLQVAAELLDQHNDGVWFVELASITNPALVPQAIAAAIGAREEAGKSIERGVLDYIADKSILIVLDNCEHLVGASAAICESILRTCAKTRILDSSREALAIAGETIYRVPSLDVPDSGADLSVDRLLDYESVSLFVDRATSVQPTFVMTPTNSKAVSGICTRLDGIPLAIELAAVRVRSMAVETVNERLTDTFRILTGGSRTAPPRQQTLRALIDWSYDLLSAAEKLLFNRLSVFSGGWTIAAAELVCSGDPIEEWEVIDLLTGLTEKSLVTYDGSDSGDRYRMLQTIRQFALEKLEGSGEGNTLRERHYRYFGGLVRSASVEFQGPGQAASFNRMDCERDNVRRAIEWGFEHIDDCSSDHIVGANVVQLVSRLVWFWVIRGPLSEGRDWIERSITAATCEDDTLVASAYNGAGVLAGAQGDYAAAKHHYELCLVIRRKLGQQSEEGKALINLSTAAYGLGDFDGMTAYLEESVGIWRELGDNDMLAVSLNNLALVALERGDNANAARQFEESAGVFRSMDNKLYLALALLNVGNARAREKDHTQARLKFREALTVLREIGDTTWSIVIVENVAMGLIDEGRFIEAATLLSSADILRERSAILRSDREVADVAGAWTAVAARLTIEQLAGARTLGSGMSLGDAGDFAISRASDG